MLLLDGGGQSSGYLETAPNKARIFDIQTHENEDEDDDEESVKWSAFNKLLESHLRISKSFLHLVKQS